MTETCPACGQPAPVQVNGFPVGTEVEVRWGSLGWREGVVTGYTLKMVKVKLSSYPHQCKALPKNLRRRHPGEASR